MTMVKIQTSPAGTFPIRVGTALPEMSILKATRSAPSSPSSCARYIPTSVTSALPACTALAQFPYAETIARFFFFKYIVGLFYKHVFTTPKETPGKTRQFASGYLAGVVCAVVSHPADSIVSLIGKPANCAEGPGLSTRVLMIGTLTGFQWWIYDSFNTLGHRWQLNVVIGVGSADVRVRELAERQLLLLSIRIRVLSYDKYFFS